MPDLWGFPPQRRRLLTRSIIPSTCGRRRDEIERPALRIPRSLRATLIKSRLVQQPAALRVDPCRVLRPLLQHRNHQTSAAPALTVESNIARGSNPTVGINQSLGTLASVRYRAPAAPCILSLSSAGCWQQQARESSENSQSTQTREACSHVGAPLLRPNSSAFPFDHVGGVQMRSACQVPTREPPLHLHYEVTTIRFQSYTANA